MDKPVRNSNHELLRIIAMFMIVFIHANIYLFYFVNGKLAFFFNGMVNGICNIGVACITRKYWFYSCYVCLLFLSEYIEKFIVHLKQAEFMMLTGIVIFILILCLLIGAVRKLLFDRLDRGLGDLADRKIMEKIRKYQ